MTVTTVSVFIEESVLLKSQAMTKAAKVEKNKVEEVEAQVKAFSTRLCQYLNWKERLRDKVNEKVKVAETRRGQTDQL